MAAALVSRVTDLFSSSVNISGPEKAQDATAEKAIKIEGEAEAPERVQPDIAYLPDEAKYKARTARRLAENPDLPKTPLPAGFPQKLESPLVWEGKDWTDATQWEHDLSAEQLKEIDDAVKHFKGLGKPYGYISTETFPLPTLGPILRDLSKELHLGRGFFVLRTIPVDNYTREENILIYAGISTYVGGKRGVQDRGGGSGVVLAHIKDLTETHPLKTIGAPAYTTDKQVFHTDIGDIISLFVLQTAVEGGVSRISSSWRVYNELAETRPDLIKTLSEPWDHDTFGADPPVITRPLLFWQDAHIIIQYARRIFTGFLALPRSAHIPPITEAQAEALDAVHFLAEKHSLGLSFQKGDIQYINNLSIFHARDAFIDSPEHKRHLLRLWLRDEEQAWKLPEALAPTWKRLYASATPDTERFPVEPENRDFVTKGAKYA
ncbi:Clavaminate synthase-like protein [Pholiota conissans]|uniref:Clavaminate synthase-like protein n=1 Tax=Pholiota conissans TaxID=109636 RepID=A0A9P6CWW3_9AGAR|nr:Clavaminate synthase-like protein [Pholiota conissans]